MYLVHIYHARSPPLDYNKFQVSNYVSSMDCRANYDASRKGENTIAQNDI